MNLLVLGGSGFIGARLIDELLRAKHGVRNFDIAPSRAHAERTTIGDVRDVSALTRVLDRCDGVVNLAAAHGDDVRPLSLYDEVNVDGAENVVRAAEANGVERIVFVSSAAVYGPDQPLADESAALRPANAYGRSKARAEAIYNEWAARMPERRSLTMLRPCVVFGEGNRGNIHRLIERIRRRRFAMIGRGDNRKSIAYVGNLVDFIGAQIANAPGTHVYNYADQPDLSANELVETIRALLGAQAARITRVPYPFALAASHTLDAIALIGGRPVVNSVRLRKFCADTRISVDAAYRTGFCNRVEHGEALARTVSRVLAEHR